MNKEELIVEKLNILPLTLYEFKLPDDLFHALKQRINNIDEVDFTQRDQAPYYGRSILGDKSLHANEGYKDLVNYIETCISTVKEEQNFDYIEKLKVCLLWANRSGTNQWHHGHRHPWSILSGIIYIQGNSGNTWFSREDDYSKIMRDWPVRNESKNSHIIYQHKPKEGHMVIFPSNLMHSVAENKDDKDRVTISFNTFPHGCVGDLKSLSGLTISVN